MSKHGTGMENAENREPWEVRGRDGMEAEVGGRGLYKPG